jgi:hypothetical protein
MKKQTTDHTDNTDNTKQTFFIREISVIHG